MFTSKLGEEDILGLDMSWRGKKRIASIIKGTIEINIKNGTGPQHLKELAIAAKLSHPCVGDWSKGVVRSPRRNEFMVPKKLSPFLMMPESFVWKQTNSGPIIHETRLYSGKFFGRDWKALLEIGVAEECTLDRDFFDADLASTLNSANKVKKTPTSLADLIKDQVVKHRISLIELSALVGGGNRFQALMDGNLPLTSDEIRQLAVSLKSSEAEVRGLILQSLGAHQPPMKENIDNISDAIKACLEYMRQNDVVPERWSVSYLATHFHSQWGFDEGRISKIIAGAKCRPEELNYLEDFFRRNWIAWSYEELSELNEQQMEAINRERNGDRNGVK